MLQCFYIYMAVQYTGPAALVPLLPWQGCMHVNMHVIMGTKAVLVVGASLTAYGIPQCCN